MAAILLGTCRKLSGFSCEPQQWRLAVAQRVEPPGKLCLLWESKRPAAADPDSPTTEARSSTKRPGTSDPSSRPLAEGLPEYWARDEADNLPASSKSEEPARSKDPETVYTGTKGRRHSVEEQEGHELTVDLDRFRKLRKGSGRGMVFASKGVDTTVDWNGVGSRGRR